MARHADLTIELEEELPPEKGCEIPRQDAKRVVARAPVGLDEERGVRQPRDQRGQGRRALVDDERDALIQLALIKCPGKAEERMRPDRERADQTAGEMDPNGVPQLGMVQDEGLDRPVGDGKQRTRPGMNQVFELGAAPLGVPPSRPCGMAQAQLVEIALEMAGQTTSADQKEDQAFLKAISSSQRSLGYGLFAFNAQNASATFRHWRWRRAVHHLFPQSLLLVDVS